MVPRVFPCVMGGPKCYGSVPTHVMDGRSRLIHKQKAGWREGGGGFTGLQNFSRRPDRLLNVQHYIYQIPSAS